MSALRIVPSRAAFTTIRAVGLVVGAIAVFIGASYVGLAIVGPQVWRFGGGSGASGAFVDFPLPLRIVNAAAILLWCLTVAGMAFVVSSLARSIGSGVRFVRTVSRAAWSLAVVLAVGSTISQIVENVARGSSLIIEGNTDAVNPVGAPIGWAEVSQALRPNLPLLGLSFVLGILAYIISRGEGVQHESDGLV